MIVHESPKYTAEHWESLGYRMPVTDGNSWYGLIGFVFTTAIVSGLNDCGYEDRWCYHNISDATQALLEWQSRNFEGEPLGWHRHPTSGRRRTETGEIVVAF